jgi:hypothetical protein
LNTKMVFGMLLLSWMGFVVLLSAKDIRLRKVIMLRNSQVRSLGRGFQMTTMSS